MSDTSYQPAHRRRTKEEVIAHIGAYARVYYRLMRGYGLVKADARSATAQYVQALRK